jgi:hypothetical protein
MKFIKIDPFDISTNTGKAYLIFSDVDNPKVKYYLSVIRPGHATSHLGVQGWQVSEHQFVVDALYDGNCLKILLTPEIVGYMTSGSNYEFLISSDINDVFRHIIPWKGVLFFRPPVVPNGGVEATLFDVVGNKAVDSPPLLNTKEFSAKSDVSVSEFNSKENSLYNETPFDEMQKPIISSNNILPSLQLEIRDKVFDNYCDESTSNSLVQYGVQKCGLDKKKAEIILAMELESKWITNEKMLLAELDSLLHRFTDSDKKLDEKEKNDAIQFLCRARSGYSQGLNFDVATRYIATFCRNNRVKMKVGFLRWEIP